MTRLLKYIQPIFQLLFLIFLFLLNLCLLSQCEKDVTNKSDELSTFNFPEIDFIDSDVYAEIKETCRTYWDLSKMIDDTFEIKKYEDEYSIHCDGYSEGKLYHFVIRVDKNGKWINDGRSLKIP